LNAAPEKAKDDLSLSPKYSEQVFEPIPQTKSPATAAPEHRKKAAEIVKYFFVVTTKTPT
jgi:hypothetical protein